MKVKLIWFVLLPFVFSWGCNYSYVTESEQKEESLKSYLEYKKAFEPWLTKHFPNNFSSEIRSFTNAKHDSKSDIGLYLYEYDVNLSRLQQLKEKVAKDAVAHYHTTDTLIFVINRFETMKTFNERTVPKITDSTYLDSTLFTGLYPIPNFIDYENPTNTNGIWLPKGFELFVLEAKSGNYCKEFDLNENFQMPKGWKNGFSRGIAISEKDKTIIYWGVLW